MNLFNETNFFTTGQFSRETMEPADASLVLIEAFFNKEEADQLYASLYSSIAWRTSQIEIYGKVHDTPRLIAWYGDAETNYTYSRKTQIPASWTPDLLKVKQKVENEAKEPFNSVLLNLYRHGKDSMGWHRDNEKELGQNPVIASVSFGETRPFHLRHKFKKDIPKLVISLKHGSLLIMKGKTQHFWEHQVPKTAKMISARINLTFRLIR